MFYYALSAHDKSACEFFTSIFVGRKAMELNMKNMKKAIILVLAVLLAMSAVSCNKAKKTEEPPIVNSETDTPVLPQTVENDVPPQEQQPEEKEQGKQQPEQKTEEKSGEKTGSTTLAPSGLTFDQSGLTTLVPEKLYQLDETVKFQTDNLPFLELNESNVMILVRTVEDMDVQINKVETFKDPQYKCPYPTMLAIYKKSGNEICRDLFIQKDNELFRFHISVPGDKEAKYSDEIAKRLASVTTQ